MDVRTRRINAGDDRRGFDCGKHSLNDYFARHALNNDMKGIGQGTALLGDALTRVLEVSDVLGCLGVLVDALDEGAAAFYTKFGFVTLQDASWPRKMFVHIETVRAAMS